jgi:ubiquinone/menaquinone biosynthesis C-methylase UbiE
MDLTKDFSQKDGILDFLGDQISLQLGPNTKEVGIEIDYKWDFKNDSNITPTIIFEWGNLERLLGTKVLHKAKKVLSIGGGGTSNTHSYLGAIATHLFVLNPGWWDLKTASAPADSVTFTRIRAVAENIPLVDASISAIEIPSTLDHVVDPTRVLSECFRVLEDGGMIGITLGNQNSWYRQIVRLIGVDPDKNHNHHHNHHFSINKVEELLRSSGFKNIETISTCFLRLPKFIERRISTHKAIRIYHFVSNTLMPRLFGRKNGGMFLTFARK